jgi:RNA polymerase sigma-70 factor (ECF subfamily)
MQTEGSQNCETPSPLSLDHYRSYLVLLARWHWNPRLQGKFDPSDVVQQTLVQAWQGLRDFRGTTEAELRAWLRQILTRHLADLARDFGRAKRDLQLERSLEALVSDSSIRLEAWLDDQQSSPDERAERNEQLVQLAAALAELPAAQQEAVSLHHLHGLSVAEIAALMERSTTAIAGLLKRGLRTLRTHFETRE